MHIVTCGYYGQRIGTVLSGSVQINSTIELPELQMQKKVGGRLHVD
jgi:hypothetical protein